MNKTDLIEGMAEDAGMLQEMEEILKLEKPSRLKLKM